MIHKQNSTYKITKDELKQFSLLLSKGLDTETMIQLSFKSHTQIIADLEMGNSLMQILTNHASDMKYLKILSEKLSLADCFTCMNALQKSRQMFLTMIVKQGMYPFLIFFFSYILLLFFIQVIMPQMMSFDQNDAFLVILSLLKFIYSFIFILCIVFLFILFCIVFDFQLSFLEHLFHSLYLFKCIDSYRFAQIYAVLMRQGLSSKECLTLMSKMNPLRTSKYAKRILQDLERGASFEESIQDMGFDNSLLFYIKAGMKTQNVDSMLKVYCKNCSIKMESVFKKISIYQQCISYSCVGILVIIVYQVLLLPLNMLYEI